MVVRIFRSRPVVAAAVRPLAVALVLLLNAALTASSDGAMTTDQHTEFWRPVAEAVAEHIMRAKVEAVLQISALGQ